MMATDRRGFLRKVAKVVATALERREARRAQDRSSCLMTPPFMKTCIARLPKV